MAEGEFESDFNQDDFRSDDAKKYDALNEQITSLLKRFDKVLEQKTNNNEFHVTHRTEGGSWISIVCAALACCCLIGIGVMSWSISIEMGKQTAELHDLRAWKDNHQSRIDKIESWKLSEQEKRK